MSEQSTPLPAIQNGPGWVLIRHEVTGGIAEVTQEAYDENYSRNGWSVAATYTDPSAPPAPVSSTPSGQPPAPTSTAPVGTTEKKEV